MSTGDPGGNAERLARAMRQLRYPRDIDVERLKVGQPEALLPLLHHCLLGYSKSLAAAIFSKGYELQGKTDHRFVELAFKVLREVFGYRPSLTPTQFLQGGYAERKVLLVHDVAQLCQQAHQDMVRQDKRARLTTQRTAVLFERQRPPTSTGPALNKGCQAAVDSTREPGGRVFDVPYEVAVSEPGTRMGESVSNAAIVQRAPLAVARAEAWEASRRGAEAPETHLDSQRWDGEDRWDGSDLPAAQPSGPSDPPAVADRARPGRDEGHQESRRDRARAGSRDESQGGSRDALVDHVVALTQALAWVRDQQRRQEELHRQQMESMAGWICVLETRLRAVEAANRDGSAPSAAPQAAAVEPDRDFAGAESHAASRGPGGVGNVTASSQQRWTGAAGFAPAEGPAVGRAAATTPDAAWGGVAVAAGQAVRKVQGDWVDEMEERFASARRLLASLDLGECNGLGSDRVRT